MLMQENNQLRMNSLDNTAPSKIIKYVCSHLSKFTSLIATTGFDNGVVSSVPKRPA